MWEYSWDAENRLASAEYLLASKDEECVKLLYHYDYQSRRLMRRELRWDAAKAGWYALQQRKYLYDEWNVITEVLNETTVAKTYVWGTDLRGTPQGAGGVGGLLISSDKLLAIDAAYLYDGNGNVTGLVKKGSNTLLAEYEYTAFGETLTAKGSYASQNTYRFSTKPVEKETGHYYYGYRYYDPVDGRWLNRDPIEEKGGLNMYAFVLNDGVNLYDVKGNAAAGPIIIGGGVLAGKALAKKIATCLAIREIYKEAQAKAAGCKKCLTCAEFKAKLLARASEITGRSVYLKKKCDNFLRGSIRRCVKNAEQGHAKALAEAIKAFGNCLTLSQKASDAPCTELPSLPNTK